MGDIKVCTLASGSSGNSVYAESPQGALLIDAGVSGKAVEAGVEAVGGSIKCLSGLILTHAHIDHYRSAGTLSRRHGVPIFMTPGTHRRCADKIGKNTNLVLFQPGAVLDVAGFKVQTIPTPHDAVDSVALVLERGESRCGVLTDLGSLFPALIEIMSTLDAVILESNYDPQMLACGPYPPSLKARITSDYGHISNEEAARLLCEHGSSRLKAAMLAHLSDKNNTPELAMRCHEKFKEKFDSSYSLHLAPRYTPSQMLVIKK